MTKAIANITQDPVTRVAAWVTPASNAAADDPVINLLAERKRLDELVVRTNTDIAELEKTLPDVVTWGKVPVRLPDGVFGFYSEKDLEDEIAKRLRWAETFTRPDGKPFQHAPDLSDDPKVNAALARIDAVCAAVAGGSDWAEKAREDFRADKVRIAELREEAGLDALYRRVYDLGDRIDELDEQIWESAAVSLPGLLGQLKLFRDEYDGDDENKLDTIIAGLREIAAKHGPGDAALRKIQGSSGCG